MPVSDVSVRRPVTVAMATLAVVVFGILFAVLWKFAWGPISDGLDKRENMIAEQIAEATHAAPPMERVGATVFGFGFCAIATSKKPFEKVGFGSGPNTSIEKYFG